MRRVTSVAFKNAGHRRRDHRNHRPRHKACRRQRWEAGQLDLEIRQHVAVGVHSRIHVAIKDTTFVPHLAGCREGVAVNERELLNAGKVGVGIEQ